MGKALIVEGNSGHSSLRRPISDQCNQCNQCLLIGGRGSVGCAGAALCELCVPSVVKHGSRNKTTEHTGVTERDGAERAETEGANRIFIVFGDRKGRIIRTILTSPPSTRPSPAPAWDNLHSVLSLCCRILYYSEPSVRQVRERYVRGAAYRVP